MLSEPHDLHMKQHKQHKIALTYQHRIKFRLVELSPQVVRLALELQEEQEGLEQYRTNQATHQRGVNSLLHDQRDEAESFRIHQRMPSMNR